jgi:PAS domain S-box-containing protein
MESGTRDDRSSALLRSIVDGTTDAVYAKDLQGRYILVNPAMAMGLGIRAEDALGRDDTALLPPDDAAFVIRDDREILQTGETRTYEEAVTDAAGRRTFLTTKGPILRRDGEVVGLFGISHDITARKRAEEARAAAEEGFRTFFDLSPVGLLMTAPDGRLLRVNRAFSDMVGYSPEELQERTFATITHPDDLPRSAALRDEILAGRLQEGEVEKRYVARDGRVVWTIMRTRLLRDAAGEPLHFLTHALDVSERRRADDALRESEGKYRRLTESLKDVIWTVDTETMRFQYVSPSVEALTGFTRDEVAGGPVDSVLPPAMADHLKGLIRRRAEAARRGLLPADAFHSMEMEHVRKDGTSVWVEQVSRYYLNEETGHVEMLAVSRDITKRRQAEEAIRTLNQELEGRVAARTEELTDAVRELEAYSYSVAHELRGPLRAIDGHVALIARDAAGRLDEEGRRHFSEVRWNAQRMGRLIDDLLAFSRAGRSDLDAAPVDMSAAARKAFAELAEDPASLSRISFSVGRLPEAVGDAGLLARVWHDLLSNAEKFSRERAAPEIVVDGEVAGKEAVYRVRDNGIGFDMEFAEKLFGLFQRLQGLHEFEGTGIGLALVRRIVLRHGGRVWAEGAPDRGATFFFTLPLTPRPDVSLSWRRLRLVPRDPEAS